MFELLLFSLFMTLFGSFSGTESVSLSDTEQPQETEVAVSTVAEQEFIIVEERKDGEREEEGSEGREEEERYKIPEGVKISESSIPTCVEHTYPGITNVEGLGYYTRGTDPVIVTQENSDQIFERALDASENFLFSTDFWNNTINQTTLPNNPFVLDARVIAVSGGSSNPEWSEILWGSGIHRDDTGNVSVSGPTYYARNAILLESMDPLELSVEIDWFDGRTFQIDMHIEEYDIWLEYYNDLYGTQSLADGSTSFTGSVLAGAGKDLLGDIYVQDELENPYDGDIGSGITFYGGADSFFVVDDIWRSQGGSLSPMTDIILEGLIRSALQATVPHADISMELSDIERELLLRPLSEAFGVIYARTALNALPSISDNNLATTHYFLNERDGFICDSGNPVIDHSGEHPLASRPEGPYVEKGVDTNF